MCVVTDLCPQLFEGGRCSRQPCARVNIRAICGLYYVRLKSIEVKEDGRAWTIRTKRPQFGRWCHSGVITFSINRREFESADSRVNRDLTLSVSNSPSNIIPKRICKGAVQTTQVGIAFCRHQRAFISSKRARDTMWVLFVVHDKERKVEKYSIWVC